MPRYNFAPPRPDYPAASVAHLSSAALTTTRLQHMDDAAEDAAVVDPARTGLIAGQKWLDPRPSLVAQPEHLAHGPTAPTWKPDRIAAP